MKHILSIFAVLAVAAVFAQPASYILTNNNQVTEAVVKVNSAGKILNVGSTNGKISVTLYNQQLTKEWEKEINITNAPAMDPYYFSGGVSASMIGNNIYILKMMTYYDSITFYGLVYTYNIVMDMNGNVSSIKSFSSDPYYNYYYGSLNESLKFVSDAAGNMYKSESFNSNGRLTKYLPDGSFGWMLDFGGDEGTGKNPTFDLECQGDSDIVISGKEGNSLKIFTISTQGAIKKAAAFQNFDYYYIHGKRIHKNADGSYLVTGFAILNTPDLLGGYTPIIIKLNKDLIPVKEITVSVSQIDMMTTPSLYDVIETSDNYYISGSFGNKSLILKMNKDFSNVKAYGNSGDASYVSKVKQGDKEYFTFMAYSGWADFSVVDPQNLNSCGWIEINATTEDRTPSTVANELYFSNLVTNGPTLQNEPYTMTNTQNSSIYKTCSYETQVGLDEENLASDFSTFPNPVQNEFTLRTSLDANSAVATLFDVMGRAILTQNITADLTSFNTSALPAGMYILKVNDKSGKVLFQNKMVKAAH